MLHAVSWLRWRPETACTVSGLAAGPVSDRVGRALPARDSHAMFDAASSGFVHAHPVIPAHSSRPPTITSAPASSRAISGPVNHEIIKTMELT